MAVRRSQNFINQQRVDVPHLRSIESAVRNDFDELLKALVTDEGKSYVVRGFEIEMAGAIGASASGLQLIVENGAILHGNSNEAGTFFQVPSGTVNQELSSTTNTRVDGAFTPAALNYVGIEFSRQVDDTTTSQVYLWNPTTQNEITKILPLAQTLDYRIVITSSTFASNVLPISIVETDLSNNVISIQDRRPMLLRLGTAGSSTPDPFYTYPWNKQSEGREENFWSSNSSTTSPFRGGDKMIGSVKEWMDTVMSALKEVKGTTYWYSLNIGGSISGLRYDLANTVMTGRGSVSHDDVTAGLINWDNDLFLTVVSTRLKYKIEANPATAHISLNDGEVAYVNIVRNQDIIPQLVFTNGADEVSSVGSVPWTSELEVGDYIKVGSAEDTEYYKIAAIDIDPINNPQSVVRLTENFGGTSTGVNGTDAKYAYGVYRTEAAPSTNRHIQIANLKDVPFNDSSFWLMFRDDNSPGTPKVYIRFLGSELELGEERQIGDNTTTEIIQYMGSVSEIDSTPDYTNATGSPITNIHLTDDESLTRGMKRLELRDDVVPRVRVVDLLSSALPTGASVTIDGEVLNDNDYVFFTNAAIEGLYKVSGVGSSIAFEKIKAFGGVDTPVNGDLIRVESGTGYLRTIWKKVLGYWKPLEVKDATLEPTGFPNRTDSELLFNNGNRTFTIQPQSPATHFDVFTKGRVYRFDSAQSIQIPDTEGIYFFFFETDGTLTYSTTFDLSIIQDKIYVATAYWDSENDVQILLADERHGMTMDGATHEYLHNKNGTIITSGGTIGFDPTADGSEDNDAQISLSDMTIRDEDIRIDITNNATPTAEFEQILDPIAKIPVFYRSGASGYWRKDTATTFPVKQGTSTIQYNNPAGPWTTEEIPDNSYMSMWIYATNSISEPVIAILGQDYHSSLSQAQSDDEPNTLLLGNLPTQEFKLLYRIIFQSSSSFANAPKAHVADVRDLRAVEDTFFAQVSPNDHGLLSGLADPDHAPTAVTTTGVTKDGGLSDSDVDVQQSLDTLNKLLGQLRIKPHPVNGNRVVITGANRILNSGTTLIQEIKNLVLDFEGAEVDFATGQVFKSDGLDTPLGIDFTPEVIPANEYLNYSITLIPSTVNLDNTIAAQLVVLPATGTNAVKADAPKAPFAQGTKLGQVTVREDSGGILPIDEASISQLGTGGGGSGGTGDANELLERLKNRLANYGSYEYMTPVIFSSVEEDLTDEANTTAEYSVVNANYEFPLAGNQFTSVQMLDAEFLAEEIELDEIELIHYWNLDSIDTGATYEVSRDGGSNWQTVGMSRIGNSDTYRGTHLFTEELTNSFSQTIGGAVSGVTDLTDLNELSRQFTLANTSTIKKITAEITKTAAATGYIYAVAVKDDGGGSPSTDPLDKIGQSSFVSIDGLVAGAQDVDFEIRFTAPAENYHIVFKTDTLYKTEYTNSVGANKISISQDGTGIVYTLEGLELDLRVRITRKTIGPDEVVSEGFGVFYKDDNKVTPVDGNVFRNVSTFVGNVDNLDTFTLDFLPDPRLLHVYEWGTGQVYRYGAFVIQGHDVIFEPNTFNKPETVSLEFLQIQGGSFDNSDKNAALLAANFLGSTDSNIDLSVAGRGILLRSADGTLYEIVIQNGGSGFNIYEVN